jgi:hypothetical protein
MRVVIKQKVARGQSGDRGTHVVPERGSIHLIRSAHSIKIGPASSVEAIRTCHNEYESNVTRYDLLFQTCVVPHDYDLHSKQRDTNDSHHRHHRLPDVKI